MIESVMLVAIGALFACLGAIALLPALWRRAVRLTRAELRATLPVTPEEIAAEKDQIRAAAALEQRRLELRAESSDQHLQAARAEIGERIALIQRHDATIAARETTIAELRATLAARDETIASLNDTVAGLERERDNLATNLSASRIANQALDQEGLNLKQAAETRQARIEEQDRQIDGLLAKVAELQNTSGALRAELQQRTEELRVASRSLREATARASILERKQAAGDALAEQRAAQVAAMQEERLRFIEEAGELKSARDAARVDAAAAASQVESLGRRVAELEAALEKSRGAGNDLVRDLMRTIETLRQEKHQADDELSAMRFEKARIEALLAREKPRQPMRESPTPAE
jgi:chromosome segregation ATPase